MPFHSESAIFTVINFGQPHISTYCAFAETNVKKLDKFMRKIFF